MMNDNKKRLTEVKSIYKRRRMKGKEEIGDHKSEKK